jgi:UTP--glucose-1-phosphate uridylyltransferase
MARDIRTVVIPAAGQGTRLLPLTKSTPKELLNVYDRPALQFAIDEAITLGVDRIVVVTHPDKPAIRDYLTPDPAAVAALRAQGKAVLGDVLAGIAVPDGIEVVFVDQSQPLGLGHAILCAERLVLQGAFAVLLPDDLILGTPCLPEMAAQYVDGHMIAAMEVRPEDTSSYGIFTLSRPSIGRSQQVSGMVEKPAPGQAPSRLAAVGRYILDPSVFATLKGTGHGAGGEIQLTDAIARDGERLTLRAFRFSGTRYDCGSRDGLLGAAIARQAAVGTDLTDARSTTRQMPAAPA